MNTNVWFDRGSNTAQARLFCIPFAGGTSSVFRNWPKLFPSTIAVCAIKLPGRERRLREPLRTDGIYLAEEIAAAIGTAVDRPFALFGHSLGALLAFETARSLRRQHGIDPMCLFFSGCPAPQWPKKPRPIHELNDRDFLEEIKSFDQSSASIWRHAELREIFLPIVRADISIYSNYRYYPEDPFDCPVVGFGGWNDLLVSEHAIKAWCVQANNDYRLLMFSGDHFFLRECETQLVREIVRVLSQCLRSKNVRGASV